MSQPIESTATAAHPARLIDLGPKVAALLNGRAKRVTPAVVKSLQKALPQARILVSEDVDQARRHLSSLVRDPPELLLSGGGDGAAVKLINLAHSVGLRLPTLGILPLGTGNAWAWTTGAPHWDPLVAKIGQTPWPAPTRRFDLVQIDDQLCHFAGVGWDARLINDYLRNLDRRSSQLVGSRLATRLHKGVWGYLYSAVRHTVPDAMQDTGAHGMPLVRLENLGTEAFVRTAAGEIVAAPMGPDRMLYDGPSSVSAVSSTPDWGYGFRAFPYAQSLPGLINIRLYDEAAIPALLRIVQLWRGAEVPGMRDYFVTHARLTFDRPQPFQIGGDGFGERLSFEVRAAPPVELVDWGRADAAS